MSSREIDKSHCGNCTKTTVTVTAVATALELETGNMPVERKKNCNCSRLERGGRGEAAGRRAHLSAPVRNCPHPTAPHRTPLHCTTLHCTTLHDTTRHDKPRHGTTQHSAIPYHTTTHHTIPHHTTPHHTAFSIRGLYFCAPAPHLQSMEVIDEETCWLPAGGQVAEHLRVCVGRRHLHRNPEKYATAGEGGWEGCTHVTCKAVVV